MDVTNFYSVPSRNISVAYPGVEQHFTPEGIRYKARYPYFLFVGALKPGKNIPKLLEAFAIFLKKSKKVYDLLLIGGDYWLDPEIDKTIKRLKLGERVKLLGFVPDCELPDYYRGAMALVVPSLVEGFCLPVVEAMACGCPVATSDIPVMREIVGKAALFAVPYSEESLAKVLERVKSEAVQKELIALGLRQVAKFSWKLFASKIFTLLTK